MNWMSFALRLRFSVSYLRRFCFNGLLSIKFNTDTYCFNFLVDVPCRLQHKLGKNTFCTAGAISLNIRHYNKLDIKNVCFLTEDVHLLSTAVLL